VIGCNNFRLATSQRFIADVATRCDKTILATVG